MAAQVHKKEEYKLIITLVNLGFSQIVMNAARDVGATGGTIVHTRGTGTPEMEKKYGIVITPDKEMVMILVDKNIADKVMEAIYKAAGLGTRGQGICFAVPVDDVIGLKL